MGDPKNNSTAPAALIRIKPTDFIEGGMDAFSGGEPEIYPDGCLAYLPENEMQIGLYFDTFGCVSFSANNALETDGNYKIANKVFSQAAIDWLNDPVVDGVHYPSYIKNGKLDFSDRDLVVLSETDPNLGNYLDKVADTARNKHLVPEAMAPWNFRSNDPTYNSKANYYSYKRSAEAQKVANEFGKRFEVRYRLINLSNFSAEAKKRVLQVLSCGNRNVRDGKYYCPVSHSSGHAMMNARLSDYTILDQYEPFLKNLEGEKDLYYVGMSFSLVEKNMSIEKPLSSPKDDNTMVQLVTAPGGFGLYLDGKIIVDDLSKILASWMIRNNGNTSGKTKALVKEQWDLYPKVNLKLEPIS